MTFDALITAIEASDFATLIRMCHDDTPELLNEATALFERFPPSAQESAMAIMLGMVHAVMEGEAVEGEQTMGVIITSVERMRLFKAQYDVAFRESMAARLLEPGVNQTKSTVN